MFCLLPPMCHISNIIIWLYSIILFYIYNFVDHLARSVIYRLIVHDLIIVVLFFIFREQRQKEANKMAVNSFPKDRDYRREVMQATATSAFASGSKYFFL